MSSLRKRLTTIHLEKENQSKASKACQFDKENEMLKKRMKIAEKSLDCLTGGDSFSRASFRPTAVDHSDIMWRLRVKKVLNQLKFLEKATERLAKKGMSRRIKRKNESTKIGKKQKNLSKTENRKKREYKLRKNIDSSTDMINSENNTGATKMKAKRKGQRKESKSGFTQMYFEEEELRKKHPLTSDQIIENSLSNATQMVISDSSSKQGITRIKL